MGVISAVFACSFASSTLAGGAPGAGGAIGAPLVAAAGEAEEPGAADGDARGASEGRFPSCACAATAPPHSARADHAMDLCKSDFITPRYSRGSEDAQEGKTRPLGPARQKNRTYRGRFGRRRDGRRARGRARVSVMKELRQDPTRERTYAEAHGQVRSIMLVGNHTPQPIHDP